LHGPLGPCPTVERRCSGVSSPSRSAIGPESRAPLRRCPRAFRQEWAAARPCGGIVAIPGEVVTRGRAGTCRAARHCPCCRIWEAGQAKRWCSAMLISPPTIWRLGPSAWRGRVGIAAQRTGSADDQVMPASRKSLSPERNLVGHEGFEPSTKGSRVLVAQTAADFSYFSCHTDKKKGLAFPPSP
jgi:hypothetical protein